MSKCTWKNCKNMAAHPQNDGYGNEWANLCDEHNQKLESAVDTMKPQLIVRAWALAWEGSGNETQKRTPQNG